VPFRTSRPCRLQPRPEALPTRGTPDFSEPSVPRHDCPYPRHRRSALLRLAAPARQNSHNSSNISVSVKPVLRKFPVWPKLRMSRNRQPGRTWTGLPKAISPNSSPSSVRAVLSSRWAELTTNSSQGEKRASELPRTARADADPSKKTRAAL
jgi:hypothetical protein